MCGHHRPFPHSIDPGTDHPQVCLWAVSRRSSRVGWGDGSRRRVVGCCGRGGVVFEVAVGAVVSVLGAVPRDVLVGVPGPGRDRCRPERRRALDVAGLSVGRDRRVPGAGLPVRARSSGCRSRGRHGHRGACAGGRGGRVRGLGGWPARRGDRASGGLPVERGAGHRIRRGGGGGDPGAVDRGRGVGRALRGGVPAPRGAARRGVCEPAGADRRDPAGSAAAGGRAARAVRPRAVRPWDGPPGTRHGAARP